MKRQLSILGIFLSLALSLSAQEVGVVCGRNIQLEKGWQTKEGYEIRIRGFEVRLQDGDSLKIIESTQKKQITYYRVVVLSGELKDKEGWVWVDQVCTDEHSYHKYLALVKTRKENRIKKEASLEYRITNGVSSTLGISWESSQYIMLVAIIGLISTMILGLIKRLSKGLGLIGLLEKLYFSLTQKTFGGISTALLIAVLTFSLNPTIVGSYAHTFVWWIFPALFFYSSMATDWPISETYSGSIGSKPVTIYGRITGWHYGNREKAKEIGYKILLLTPLLGFVLTPVYLKIFGDLGSKSSSFLLRLSLTWILFPISFGIVLGLISSILAHIIPIPTRILKMSKPIVAVCLLGSFFSYIIVTLVNYFL